jgi:hypothetical protein
MYKVHAFISDNASSNDAQTTQLQKKNNSFNVLNHVRCFNHTIQLSCKALLKPFTSYISSSDADNDNMQDLEGIEEDKDDENEDEDEDEELACNTDDNIDNDIDELDTLSGEKQATFLEMMAVLNRETDVPG